MKNTQYSSEKKSPRIKLEEKLKEYVKRTESRYTETLLAEPLILVKSDYMNINEQIASLIEICIKNVADEKYLIKYHMINPPVEKFTQYKYRTKEEIKYKIIPEEFCIKDEDYENKPFGIVINFISYDLKRYSFIITMD